MNRVLDILSEKQDDPIDHEAEADYLEKAKDADILKWSGKASLKDARAHHRQMIAYHRQRAAAIK